MQKLVFVLMMGSALAGCGRDPGPAGPKATPAHRVPQGRRVPKESKAFPDRRGNQGPQGTPGPKGDKGDKGDLGQSASAVRAVQADSLAAIHTETLVSVLCPAGGAR